MPVRHKLRRAWRAPKDVCLKPIFPSILNPFFFFFKKVRLIYLKILRCVRGCHAQNNDMSLTLPAAEVTALTNGASKCLSLVGSDGKSHAVIIARGKDGKLRAGLNSCSHLGGTFAPVVGDMEDAGKMKCTMHGWLLDPMTMTYVESSNPKLFGMTLKKYEPGTKHPELVVAVASDGSATLTLPEGAATGSGCMLA